jgi:hypothetical protein
MHVFFSDPRFNSSFDKQSGFKTRNILAAAVRDDSGKISAVLQVRRVLGT